MPRQPNRAAARIGRGAAALYRRLLVCYPRRFREASGPEPAALFGEACRDDWSRLGAFAVARRIAAALVTVPLDGLFERRANARERRAEAAGQRAPGGGPALAADLRHALRAVRRQPALSIAIAATLGVGIGVNTAAFSVIDATLLRPLPYVHASRVVWLDTLLPSGRTSDPNPSWARAWVAAVPRVIERLEMRRWRSALITGAGAATRERLIEATPGYLPAIGARPVVGRFLTPQDSQPGAAPVVVISAAMWRDRFGARADIVGTTMAIDGVASRVVGVASEVSADIAGLEFRMVAPLADRSDEPARSAVWLRPGVTLERAQSAIAVLPPEAEGGRSVRPHLSRPNNLFWQISEFRTIELTATAAGWLVLIIAAINVGNMLLASGQTRLGELAVRRALGASPLRIVRLLLFETALRAVAGAALGLGVAWVLVRWIRTLYAGPQWQTALDRTRLDPLVVTYAFAVALVAACAAALVPAMRSARSPQSGRHGDATRSVSGLRRSASTLMAVETGLSVLLLVASSLVAHAFLSMHFADPGFDADRLLGVRLALPPAQYPTPASRAAFFDKLLDDVSRLPGVERAGIGYGAAPPTGDFFISGRWTVAGSTRGAVELFATRAWVTPGYFALVGLPLLQGEDFRPSDVAAAVSPDAAQPTVISRGLAAQLFPDGVAVGVNFEVRLPTRVMRYRVIGVAGDMRVWSLLAPDSPNRDAALYLPLPENRQYTDVLLRVRSGAPLPVGDLRAAVARLDPDVPSDDDLRSAAAGIDDFISRPHFTAWLFSVFAALAVLLVAIGLSAIVSHAVRQRTREMGIRLALGARPGGVQRLVLVQGLRPALAGLAAGLAASLAITRYMRALLYGLSPTDPLTMIVVPILVVAIVVAALVVPSRRASRVDPIAALRVD